MDKLKQYYTISEIKPDYHRLLAPYNRPGQQKIKMNLAEISLYYLREFGIYIPDKPVEGSAEILEDSCVEVEHPKVLCMEMDL